MSSSSATPGAGDTNITNVVFAIKTNNDLYGWGKGAKLGKGDSNGTYYDTPQFILSGASTIMTYRSIYGYPYEFTALIKTDGTLWLTGYLSPVISVSTTLFTKYNTMTWKFISIGGVYANIAAIDTSGKLWVGGDNQLAQLGQGHTNPVSGLVQIGSSNWQSATFAHTGALIAVNLDGSLWTIGSYRNGNVGLGMNNAVTENATLTRIGSSNMWRQLGLIV